MSVGVQESSANRIHVLNTENREEADTVRVAAGDSLALRIKAFDPAGIRKIGVQCFQFSIASTNKTKLAYGELIVPPEEAYKETTFEIIVQIPKNAALGKWGIQTVEFTNGRGYKVSFYRGQDKFDDILFDVVQPPTKDDELLKFSSIEIAS